METTKKYLLILTGVAALFAVEQQARAAFELNFLPHPGNLPDSRIIAGTTSTEQTYASCAMPGSTVQAFCFHSGGGNAPAPDNTPFLREYIELLNPDGTPTGASYVHMIVGSLTTDPITGVETGFAQEVYIRSGNGAYSASGGKPGCNNTNAICGGSHLEGGATMPWNSGNGQIATISSIGDPLSGNQHLTGNGTGDPTRVIIRQVLKVDKPEGRIEQEFLKAGLLTKPKITQNITSTSGGTMSSQFVLDMTNSDYLTNTTSGVMVNRLTLNDPTVPQPSRFFDAIASSQSGKSDVSAGRYTFASGAGWVDRNIQGAYSTPAACGPATSPPDANGNCVLLRARDDVWLYDQGSYAYTRGGADISNIDWKVFKNVFENPL